MRIALVHDDLIQRGGAERVLEGLSEIFPDAPIFTSVFDYSNNQLTKKFAGKIIFTSFLQKIPGWQNLYKTLLPLYPIAFEQFNFDDFDLVISHTTRFAKAIITKPKTTHICYCHTPPRFLWRLSGETNYGFLESILSKLRIYDRISARRVDYFFAGSENAKRRIKKIYSEEAKVIYPFIDFDKFKNVEVFDGGYFLVISRFNKYKRIDLVVEVCLKLGVPLKVIGTYSKEEQSRGLVQFLGNMDDDMVVKVLSGAKALIIAGEEDFGLVSLEAQALGKPVIAFKGGGNLETIIDGITGILFNEQSVESLVNAFEVFKKNKFSAQKCKENAQKFTKKEFESNFKNTLAELGYTI